MNMELLKTKPTGSFNQLSNSKAIVSKALDFPPPPLLIERYAKENKVTEAEAFTAFQEVKKFLAVCATKTGHNFVPSKEVDSMWHTFILFTKSYGLFCHELGGYIHHQPTGGGDKRSLEGYINTLQALSKVFGNVDAMWWPQASSDSGFDCCDHECAAGVVQQDKATHASRVNLLSTDCASCCSDCCKMS